MDTAQPVKMNPDAKQLWIEALESGEYPQTVKRLNRPVPGVFNGEPAGYCCLGVLCDVYLKATGKGKWQPDGHFGMKFIPAEFTPGSTIELPREVIEWSGVSDKDQTRLVTMNDGEKRTFVEIAQYIRENL